MVGSGLSGQLGAAAESAYGTYTVPTRFVEPNKVDIKKNKGIAQGGGLAAGRLVKPGSRRVVAFEDGGGSFDLEVPNKGFGLFLAHAFGGTPTVTQQAASAAYLQTHALSDNVGKSLTLQSGIPDTTGTVRPYTFLGSKITSIEFTCAQGSDDGKLMSSVEVDARQVSEGQSLAVASYPTNVLPFHFAQMGVKLGTFGSEAAVQGVKGMSLKLERGQDVERFYANNAGLKAEPLTNDNVSITGQFDVDFVDKTVFADRFASDGSTSLVWEFIGPLIASTYYQTFRLRVPMIFLDGDTPVLDGPGIVSGPFAFTGQFDLTNAALSCEYMSVDTAI